MQPLKACRPGGRTGSLAAAVFAVSLVFALPGNADGTLPGWNRLVYLMYRFEVTQYCSLASERIAQGFQQRRNSLIAYYRFAGDAVESAQSEAWKLAYREWDNRGLGGFRRWCGREGLSYSRFFESLVGDDD